MKHGLLVAALTVLASVSFVTAGAGAPPFYQLLPFDYPGPLIRVCHTDYGICVIPFTIQPGALCQCAAPNGTWVPGVTVH